MERFCRNSLTMMSLRTYLLLLLFFGSIYVTYAEKDFEFSDKKTLLETTDDEELQNGEPGSGSEEDLDENGSGTALNTLHVAGYPEYYRVTINITDIIYTPSLADRNSRKFQQLAQELADVIELLFLNVQGSQLVTVLKFSPSSLLVTFDLGTQGFYDKEELLSVLNKAIASGQMGSHTVSPHGFSFKELSEAVMCPTEVGRPPSRLPNSGNNFANLLINNAFPCAGHVIAWEYYRIIPRWSGFVGIWREISETEFMLVGKTELPVADEGFHIVNVEPPIRVRKGDFIGIFYPRSVEEGVVAGADHTTADVPRNELYENYYIQLYADTVEENVPVSLNDVPYNVKSSTFAIRAHMDYVGIVIDEIPPALPCTSQEFMCNDGECVDINYQCDRQIDCYDGSDEDNCDVIKCAPDEFRCHDGIQCVHNAFYCDGAIECQDGSDESDCPHKTDCRSDQFRCVDGTCVEWVRRCDSRVDCPDMTDEYNCASVPCRPGQFRCERGQCIDERLKCDGFVHCLDTSDELDCPSCDGYHCQNGQCIDLRNECDGYPDCDDGSDESDCPLCAGANDFQCADGMKCIPRSARCDRTSDCADGSDEDGCPIGIRCKIGEFMCVDQRQCIPLEQKCDLLENCADGSDEAGCDPIYTCPEGLFHCDDQSCIDIQRNQRCDGRKDCEDGSDEFPKYCNCTNPHREFMCHDGKECIDSQLRCNRNNDCTDASDELGCSCFDHEFQCNDGACINAAKKCDGTYDCGDYSDEFECPLRCTNSEFMCASQSQCVDIRLKCDDYPDCSDGSDEVGCACSDHEYRCVDGTCIDERRKCDGHYDCPDQTDESDCPLKCTADQFMCASQTECVDFVVKCDGYPDCLDGSDEHGCEVRCRNDEYKCEADNVCIPSTSRCNRNQDCSDGSDEFACPCRDDEFTCEAGQCIPSNRRCDHRTDCENGRDEENCPCRDHEFTCDDGQCIPSNRRCDRRSDCEDGSDEQNCQCRDDEFTCDDGQCIPSNRRCDRRSDCEDGSDEQKCQCRDDEFTCDDGQCIPSNRRCDRRSDCEDGSDEQKCQCRDDEFTCDDSQCIPSNRRCDHRSDCEDGSDEQKCGPDCSAEEHECDGRCIDSRYVCDGRADCRDGTDEHKCRPVCTSDEFQCRTDGRCVDRHQYCDGHQDCADGSDEEDCRPVCTDDQFACRRDGYCIASRQHCDGRQDCSDGSDEENCRPVCTDDQFVCRRDGRCIDSRQHCDGRQDCTDGSDEYNCRRICTKDQFVCRQDGLCIDPQRQCDGRQDCSDGSDERNCQPVCNEDQYVCHQNGYCIDHQRQCDGFQDCPDGSDEENCWAVCTDDQFVCRDDSRCIDLRRRCDGRQDCSDGSDEDNCRPECRSDQYQCQSRECIDQRNVCDGRADCTDQSDESNCPVAPTCGPNFFRCGTGHCLDERYHCDGRPNCPDGSDERECPIAECEDDEFMCISDRTCIDQSSVCNRHYDCLDGSDESDCPTKCRAEEFQCESGRCVHSSARCNGRVECEDGSDERNCPRPIIVTVTPKIMTVREGREVVFECQATGSPPPTVRWSRVEQDLPLQASEVSGRLTIPVSQVEDSGSYVCSALGVSGNYRDVAQLTVVRFGPTEVPPVDGCRRNEAVCQNGQCIPQDYRCDGENDCSDGSDEQNCSISAPCEPNELRCDSGRCVMKIWRCDGDNDCGDGSDERNCPTKEPGAPCRADEYQCLTGDQCVPAAYQCDGEIDCQDRSDEIGCAPPTIIVPPIPNVEVEIGGEFTIICEAVGVPTPLIVWRLNWGNIPTGDRVTVFSQGGKGRLTIRDVIPEDSGAYTCEAINTKGSIFAIPDAIIIVRRLTGVCQPPVYNVDAGHRTECVPCFCFDHTTQCYSSDLYVTRITLANTMQLINRQTMETMEQVYIDFSPTTREHTVTDFFRVLPSGSYYWNLPREFLGYQLPSYGGDLKYTILYQVAAAPSLTDEPDVIVMGNGITLYHRTDSIVQPGRPHTVTVPLVESAWESTEGPHRGDTPISEYASKADLVMALENVTSIWIRASYDLSQTLSRIGGISMTTAVSTETGDGRAVLVEDCSCPTGYRGLSCQDCALGFYRVQTGEHLGSCRPCNCHGHSNDCDAATGVCMNCQHHTTGYHCEICMEGFVGHATRGTPTDCQPCPCPLTIRSNQFSPTCEIDRFEQIICNACPVGYDGHQCEHCAPGYVGNPKTPGDFCRRTTVDEFCDPRGSLQRQPNPITGQCQCKENVEGITCDKCTVNTFFLNENNPYGCLPCFCMGLTKSCTSTSWNRMQIGVSFMRDSLGFKLADMIQEQVISDGFRVNPAARELMYSNFNNLPRDTYYWSLPQRFLGDKVTSYGGSLRFVLQYRPGIDSSPYQPSAPLVEITGNDFTLAYRNTENTRPNMPLPFDVKFTESNWMRVPDGEAVTREVLLMALADLDSILIRATFTVTTDEASIRDVTLDVAEHRSTGQDRALAVEQCICPRGHRGLSCEDCDTGYTRSGTGLYLGLCVPCYCNGHSSECDPETGVCRNCQHNTEGNHCESCTVGYYGDATKGTPSDCQSCPCPLTTPPNQFSQTCILDVDKQVTCTSCPAGHTGRRCESCIAGYRGEPSRPGDYCKIPEIRCECDNRGTIANAQCDPETKKCPCKPFVHGLRCASCKDGYFYLDQDNPQGCLSCFCMGITNQCQISNYYRDMIRPQFNSDGTHNFVMTNRRLNNVIQDGFRVNAHRNEITFDQFDGVQMERESLFFNLPARFRGDKVSSYGGTLQFTLEYDSKDGGHEYRDVDIEIINRGHNLRMYHLYNQRVEESQPVNIQIPIRESSFIMASSRENPSREVFMTVLADIEAILVRATYNKQMQSVTLRDLSLDVAVPTPTSLGKALYVESCRCPDGYTGLSCQTCAPGYLRVQDTGSSIGRCVRCSCNGHATSCDPHSGKCLSCQHNTEGDRCERCIDGYYGDATVGTIHDCRPCPCPLTIPSNQFARTCYLATDDQVTCHRCKSGYSGRDCGTCVSDYYGNPREIGGTCRRRTEELRPVVTVTPIEIEEPIGSTVSIQCSAAGQRPFNIVWSRLDARPLPGRARQGPRYTLTIQDLVRTDTGRYVCTASNVYGSSRGYVDITVVARKQQIRVRIDEPTRVTVDEGGTARFVCHAMGSLREVTYIISWERRDGHLPSRAIDQNGVLVIPNVQREDGGTYICTGSDMYSVDSAHAILIVGSKEELPQVRIEPRYMNVDEGEPVVFQCIASGHPTPSLEWVRRGDEQLNPLATFENGFFRIPAASLSDQSEYYCRATNAVGASEVKAILNVKSGPRPPDITVIVRHTSIIAVVGTTATLECYVEDRTGQVVLVWSRHGAGLPPGSRQVEGTLMIPNVQQSYSGNYICRGTTPTGITGTATTTLTITPNVEQKIPTANIEPQRKTIPMGTTGTLRCIVTGKPQPVVTWSKARGELSSNHQVVGETLRIIRTSMEDRGVYICTATNVAGSAQGWSAVEVERRMMPKIDIYPEISQTISIGQNALFQCRIMDGDPPPTISWSRVAGESFTSTTDVMDNGVLMFHAVTGEEMGGYVCSATNEMGTISATATLIIQGPPTITIQPSKIIYTLVGERVTVECIAEGDPRPNVHWQDRELRRGDLAPEATEKMLASEGSAHLVFNSITLDDSRTYICVAQNEAGTTKETVQIRVENRPHGSAVGVSISGPGTLSIVEGQNVDLTCTSRGLINPAIRWRRREGILPPNHQVRNGNLHIPRFQEQYQGEYICSARAAQGDYESSVFIIVTVSPRLTVSPQRIAARAGDRIELNCRGSGPGPFQIEWRKVNGVISSSVIERDGLLTIQHVTAADAGEYRCTVTNSAGTNEGYALVEVQVPPTVVVTEREVVGNVGQRLELRCQASGTPQPIIRWEKELGHLPVQHNIQNGILTIYRLESEDTGRYICTATSEVGSSRDFTYLKVQNNGPDIGTDVRVDTQTVDVGDRVEMECIVRGTPRPTVTWSRLEGQLPASAIIHEELLIIPDAKEVDAGTYVCTAVNVAGSVSSRVILYVRAKPIISRQSDMQTAALGSSITLACDAHGYPQPDINWYRNDGYLPRDHNVVDGKLEIPRIRAEDAGTYVCSAENQYGYDEEPIELVVGDLVPYFQQNPVSYMSYPPLQDAYLDFDIELNLRPETLDGLVLYNGQYDTGVGDFVCFGLQGGYPELRYDVGSGPAVIRGNHSLELNQWHKVTLSRNRKEGSMIVNDQPAYTGKSPGRFQGLDLLENMYVGAVPDFERIPRAAGYRTGFVGSISEIQLKGVELVLGEDAVEIQGIEPFNSCFQSPCENGATCISANNAYGFECVCTRGFTGFWCEGKGERCYSGACGQGRCFNLDQQSGYQCVCPFGKTGKGCQIDLTLAIPSFNKTSFISYSTIEDGLMQLTLGIEIKLNSLDDGLVLYDAGSNDGSRDFIALLIKDQYLEFRFDTGSGPAVVRSRNSLPLGEWIQITAERKGREGSLKINDEEPVKVRQWNFYNNYYNRYYYRYRRYRRATAPGRTVGLNLQLPLYLGGVDPATIVSSGVGINQGFVGCIAQLTVNGHDVDLVADAIESANVADCGQRQPCDRNPCHQGGYCEELPNSDYRCNCPNEYTGKNCEIEINICVTRHPCENGAPCSIRSDGNYKCDCLLGFIGSNCESRIELGTSVEVGGDGFVEFDKELLPHANGQEHEVVSFTISTTEPNGLIFWQGKDEGSPIRGGDYLAIAVKDGYVELSYELGSGPAMIQSSHRVDTGYQYKIIASRLGRTGTLIISGVNGNNLMDDSEQVQGDSQGILQMLNVEGNIYIGGVPNLQQMTDEKFTHNFNGCIKDIVIHEHGPMTVPENAVGGYNVRPCVD